MAKENCAFHEVFLRYSYLNAEKRTKTKVSQFSTAEFPPLLSSTQAPVVPSKSSDRPGPATTHHDTAPLYSSASKKVKTSDGPIVIHSMPDKPKTNTGYDRSSYQKALLYPQGRPSHVMGQTSQSRPLSSSHVDGSLTKTTVPEQITHDLKKAVDTLEALLLTSTNPMYKSLAKMIRTAIEAPTRPLIISRTVQNTS